MTVIDRLGAARLAAIIAALTLVLVLHLVRSPLLLLARVLAVSMRRLDAYATRQAAYPLPPRKESSRGSYAR